MAGELDALKAEVTRASALIQQAITLLQTGVPATDVAAETAALKAADDSLNAILNP